MDKCPHQKEDGSCEGCELLVEEPDTGQTEDYQIRWTLDQIHHKLLVMSGKGGVGKTSVAVALALLLARRGYAVGLMDIDLHGPDVYRLLGVGEPLDLVHGQYYLPAGVPRNLKLVSVEAMMKNRDAAVIWRGPIKHKIIRQFLTEIQWGHLDFLIIDAPPGTGDEPLTVARTIPEVQAVIVTTPQEISLADVRKAIQFCQKVDLQILGVVENMGHVRCPDCGKVIPLFSSGQGSGLLALGLPVLGSVPFDPEVVAAADEGRLAALEASQSPFFQAMEAVVTTLLEALPQVAAPAPQPQRDPQTTIFAAPVVDGNLAPQCNQSQRFLLITVRNGQIVDQVQVTPPDFKPGLLPHWLERQGVTHLIAAGLPDNARKLFQRKGVEVIAAEAGTPLEGLIQELSKRP
ncbi:MAG: P-loop NTPase [Desulfobacca sp.]|uniref:P-loop NTPase n=1 Tax=Desulfobacca sp. TaxID=2067990 RepID=UPI00404B4CCF